VSDTLPIDSIVIGKRHRRDLGDVNELAKSIETVGLLHPVVVTRDNRLVAGERRILACETLGWTDVPVRFVDLDALVLGEHAENEVRKDFTTSERVDIGKEVEAELGKRQGQRTDLFRCSSCGESFGATVWHCPVCAHHHGFDRDLCNNCHKGVRPSELPANMPEVKGETRAEAARKAGFSSTTQFRQAKTVVDSGVPELVDKMDRNEVSISGAALIAKQPQDEQQRILAEGKLTQAVADLRAAKDALDLARTLTPVEPLTAEQKARQNYVFGTREDRVISAILDEIVERIAEQPDPAEAVRRIPPAVAYAVDTQALRHAAEWLLKFIELWEQERISDVAAE
jgi:hypothetical protein